MKRLFVVAICTVLLISCQRETHTIYLDEMDLSTMDIEWGTNQVNKSVEGNPLTIAGQLFDRGVGTHAVSKMMIDLHGTAKIFSAMVGVDNESGERGSVEFFVMGDKKILWQSGLMKKGDPAKAVEVDLIGIEKMALYISDGGNSNYSDHADWADAVIEYYDNKPDPGIQSIQEAYI
nr:NPCBM/NEW2 domain-containing protein [Bacteroidota bacterium]